MAAIAVAKSSAFSAGAIAASARRKDLTPENVRSIRKFLVETIAGVAKSMKSATGPDQRVMALQRVLVGVRNDLLEMPQTERGAIFRALAPALVEIISAASAQWTKAHDDKTLTASYASVMNSCEVLLRLIDRSERASAGVSGCVEAPRKPRSTRPLAWGR
jgi:hypothetical protein